MPLEPDGEGPDAPVRPGPVPVQRGDARPALRAARGPSDRGRRGAGHVLRRLGAERRGGLGGRRLQRLGSRAQPARSPRASSGIWEAFVPGVGHGAVYKFHIASRVGGYRVDKGDPFATFCGGPAADGERRLGPVRTSGTTTTGCGREAPRNALDAPVERLRGAPRLVDARRRGHRCSATASSATALADHVERAELHPRRAPARHGASRSTARGATRAPATSRPPAGTARRRTSWP